MKKHLFALVAMALLMMSGTAAAVEVQTHVAPGMNRDMAIAQALDRALLQESLGILPGQLNEARQILLSDELARLRSLFVITYTEVSSVPGTGGEELTLNVAVNRQGLELWLRNAGLFHTLNAELPYNLVLRAETTDEEIASLSRLQALSGVRPQENGNPTLVLERPAGNWNGRLETGGTFFLEQSPDLETLWFALWAHYFSRQTEPAVPGMADTGREEPPGLAPGSDPDMDMVVAVPGEDGVPAEPGLPTSGTDEISGVPGAGPATMPGMAPGTGSGNYLVVSGWFSSDGVLAFHRELSSWEGVGGSASFIGVSMSATGHQGKWLIPGGDSGALAMKLSEYAAAHGLQFRFTSQ